MKKKSLFLLTTGPCLVIAVLVGSAMWIKGSGNEDKAQPALKKEAVSSAQATPPPSVWGVVCKVKNQRHSCGVAQELRQKKDNQRVLLLEIVPDDQRGAIAELTLPFGLNLSKGIILKADKGAVELVLPFLTCMPQGCVATMRLNESAVTAIWDNQTLRLNAWLTGGEDVIFDISLRGFREAYARALTLNRQSKENDIAK